jgi:hypothetical protein
MRKHSGMISFEEVAPWLLEIADVIHIPGIDGGAEDDEKNKRSSAKKRSVYRGGSSGSSSTLLPLDPDLAGLGEFLRFLLSLDDYTMGILAEVISPGNECPGGGRTIADLARLHKCSRQAMHRKTLASVRRYPELAGVLSLVLRKIGRSRSMMRRKEREELLCG